MSIDTAEFYASLHEAGIDFFTGVPDSLLQDLCAYIEDNAPAQLNVIAANEGNAVALAMGYHLASGKFAAVYLQNSGIGNTINPLLSLADPDVYGVPMLFIIGWRGEPGVKDEPQHVAQGRLTLPLLETLGVPHQVLDADDWRPQLAWAVQALTDQSRPVALVVRKGTFSKYPARPRHAEVTLTREAALEAVIAGLTADDIIVSTTGKTSREVFEIRERNGQDHERDFLTVGGMGHASSIAMGMSIGSERTIYCIDGDGAFLMHLGGLPVVAQHMGDNYRYVLINNGAHESVGGQPTVADRIDIESILTACGFRTVETVSSGAELPDAVARLSASRGAALVINVAQGSRDDLGRPTQSPSQNKVGLMRQLGARGDR